MRHFLRHISVLLLWWVSLSSAGAQVFGLDRQTVTIQVLPITDVQIIGGGISLSIDGATVIAGQDMMTVTDQNSSLRWATNSANRKVTAATNLAAPLFSLRLMAVNPTQGTAAPEMTLSTAAMDLLLNIGRSTGTAVLRYTGIAYASQGPGTDNHIITFTIQTQ